MAERRAGCGIGEQRQAVANRVLSKVVDFIESSRDLVVDDYQLGFC
jgi:hypothetical protein